MKTFKPTPLFVLFLLLYHCSFSQLVPHTYAPALLGNISGLYEKLPKEYSKTKKKYPLIIYIHGIQELGGQSPLITLKRNGIPKMIDDGKFPETVTSDNQDYSFIVLCPQFVRWPIPDDVNSFIDYAKKKYRIDNSRIYLTGFSMGGGAAWDYAAYVGPSGKSLATSIQAIAPIAGAKGPDFGNACRIAASGIAVWAFQNDEDSNPGTPPIWTKSWVAEINECSSVKPLVNAKATFFHSKMHGGWEHAYDPEYKEDGKNLYEWFLSFKGKADRRSSSIATSGTKLVSQTNNSPVSAPAQDSQAVSTQASYSKGNDTDDERDPSTHKPSRIFLEPDANGVLGIDDVKKMYDVKGGDTLFLRKGNYSMVYLGNIQGSPNRPVIITNYQGLVKIGVNLNYTVSFQLYNSKYFRLEGSGDPNIEYGIDISGKLSKGNVESLYLNRGVSDFRLDHLYIHDATHLIVALQMPSCEHPEWTRENYVMKNVRIDHIKGFNSNYEGFYIGPTVYFTNGKCGKQDSHLIKNIEIDHNTIENSGNEAIQLAMASQGVNSVHNNTVRNYGRSTSKNQTNGILIGGAVKADIYQNLIIKGSGNGIQLLGGGINKVYNNVIINAGADGIQVGQRILFEPLVVQIINNTIINAGIKSISIYDSARATKHIIYNNLMVHQGSQFNRGVPGIDATEKVADMQSNLYLNNITTTELNQYMTGKYTLNKNSKDAKPGKNLTNFGIFTDFNGNARPKNQPFDIGAYEVTDNQSK